MRAQQTTQSVQSEVAAFPSRAGDALVNTLFFDLIEPTFGSEQRFQITDRSAASGLEGSRALSRSYVLAMRAEVRASESAVRIGYRNTGADALRGDRTIGTSTRSRSVHLAAGLRRTLNPTTWITAEGEFQTRRVEAQALPEAVPTSEGRPLDLTDLGGGVLAAHGGGVGMRLRRGASGSWAEASVSASRTRWRGRGSVSTPVLGYLVSSTLPISHRFSGTASAHAVALRARFAAQRALSRRFYLRGAVSATRARAAIVADSYAALAHGLSDASSHHTQDVRLTALRLTLLPSVRVGRGEVRYAFDQSIPLVDTGAAPAATADPLRVRGGATHTLSYLHRFDR